MDDLGQRDADDSKSNLIRRANLNPNSSPKLLDIARRLCLEKRIKSSLYSPGFRYFYWKFYDGNTEKRNRLWRVQYEGYTGYKLKDWFIAKKYDNLKDEALNNNIAPFTLYEYRVTLCKSKEKLTARAQTPNGLMKRKSPSTSEKP